LNASTPFSSTPLKVPAGAVAVGAAIAGAVLAAVDIAMHQPAVVNHRERDRAMRNVMLLSLID
jgi:uncharacterized integral membrane protein